MPMKNGRIKSNSMLSYVLRTLDKNPENFMDSDFHAFTIVDAELRDPDSSSLIADVEQGIIAVWTNHFENGNVNLTKIKETKINKTDFIEGYKGTSIYLAIDNIGEKSPLLKCIEVEDLKKNKKGGIGYFFFRIYKKQTNL